MNTESVLARILPAVEQIIKAVVNQAATTESPLTFYDLEARRVRTVRLSILLRQVSLNSPQNRTDTFRCIRLARFP
jgi:hypothetical protein